MIDWVLEAAAALTLRAPRLAVDLVSAGPRRGRWCAIRGGSGWMPTWPKRC